MSAAARAARGSQECVEALIAAKADVNHASEYGCTALMWAAYKGNQGCVRALFDARADVSQVGRLCPLGRDGTALIFAANKGHQLICELLVERWLYIPKEEEIKCIVALLGCFKKLGHGRDIRSLIGRALRNNEIYWYNRSNFEQAIAGQAVAKLPEGPIQTALLEKYVHLQRMI